MPGGGPGEELGVDGGVEGRPQHPIDRSGGTGTDLTGKLSDESLHVGLAKFRQLDMAEARAQVAADGRLIPNDRRCSLVLWAVTHSSSHSATVTPAARDGCANVPRTMSVSASDNHRLASDLVANVSGAGTPSGSRAW